MKQIYTKLPSFLLFFTLLFYLPYESKSQCTCSGGLPATPIAYSVTIAPTISSTLIFTFPQFDPAIGTLSCVRLNDTISGITTTGALNKANVKKSYKFQLTLANNISGPGISIDQNFNKVYGPDSLGFYGDPTDTITYGPDPVFTNDPGTAQTGGNGAYLGLGTVNFTYTINGGMVALSGGLNYNSGISTTIGGTLALTYYWCPITVLANSINGFAAIKSGNAILLKWTGQNEQNTDTYEIEYSKDGIHFSAATKIPAYVDNTGAASKYEYQYNLAGTTADRLFFRIKKTNAAGKAGYSAIRVINLGAGTTAISNFQLYPNPASKHLNVEWSSPVTGNISVAVVNTVGQQVYQQAFELNGSNNIQLDLPASAKPGVYYVLLKDITNHSQQLTKLMIH
jgi:hypothetical protein